MRSRTLPALLAAAALAVSACGGSDEETTTGPATNPGNAGQEQGGAKDAPNTVVMKDIAFEPEDITVKAGDTVTWVNEDEIEHDVFAEGTPGLKSELFGKDGTYEYTAEEAGEIAYVCTVHPGMEGTITVE